MGEKEGETITPQYSVSEVSTAKPKRHIAITVAAILFIIGGILSILGAVALFLVGGLAGTVLPGIGLVFGGMIVLLGLVILVVGVLDFIAGYWLWKNLRKGGILGLILAGLGIVIAATTGNIVGALVDIFIIILIVIGWKNLV